MGTTQEGCDPPTSSQADAPCAENQADQWINAWAPSAGDLPRLGPGRDDDPITAAGGVLLAPRRRATFGQRPLVAIEFPNRIRRCKRIARYDRRRRRVAWRPRDVSVRP